MATHYGLVFFDLRNYSVDDLLKGRRVRYPKIVAGVCYKGHFALFKTSVLPKRKIASRQHIKGSMTFKGKKRGIVKIVHTVADIR